MSIYRIKGASGAVINQAHTLGATTVIGSADGCDLQLDVDGVAPRHAEIRASDKGLLLVNLDSGFETRLNGEAVTEAALAGGDEIRIASCRWVLQAPGLRPEKVLTEHAVRRRRSHLRWLIPLAILSAAALAWQRGWLPI